MTILQANRAFEVASIRPVTGPPNVVRGYKASGPRLTLEAYSIVDLITEAYGLKPYQVTVPKALGEAAYIMRYNIVAKAEGDATPRATEFREMLQTLLVERFNLKFHRETREVPVYALMIGKGGPKLKESADGTAPISIHGAHGRNQTLTMSKATMEDLASGIQNLAPDRPVVNKTGLTGTYDIKLEATPEYRVSTDPQPGDVSIFTAVRETLGLKLEPQKASIKVMAVDGFNKPSEN